jgi:hypothetical protein
VATVASKPRRLRKGRPEGTIDAPQKGERMAGRKRTINPDPRKPEGQCALYLQRLLKDKDVDVLAEQIGKNRSTIFNYLGGSTTPSDSIRDKIAKAIGLQDYRDLMPPDDFLVEIGQKPRRKKRSG